jgi:hypothetical protein
MDQSGQTVSAVDLEGVEGAIYAESFRTLDEQAKVLDGLRARAGTLVGVANVATAFVGGLALTRHPVVELIGGHATTHPRVGAVGWAAIALYVAVMLLAFLTYAPSRNWVFTHHPHGLIGAYLDPGPPVSLSEFRRTIAYYNGTHYDRNGRRLSKMFALLAAATVCFVVELILWLWILAR